MTIIEEIKERLKLEDLVAETATVRLRKSGVSMTGFCPFHHNTNTPSLVVWPGTQTWKCFGACNEGGDHFDWVMKQNPGWDLKEAIKFLAAKANVPFKQGGDELKGRLSAQAKEGALKVSQRIFQRWLIGETDREGKIIHKGDTEALAYALDRGWTMETIRAEGIGFSGHATAEAYKEMRDEFQMYGVDLLSPEAVMVLGFKGNVKTWAETHNIDPNDLGENHIMGLMETPGLIYAHKFDGKIEYLSSRFLPEWEEKRGRKSHNPNSALAGKKRPYFNSLHRSHHAEGKSKGALIHIVEGQGDSIAWRQFKSPAMALCGASWRDLEENGTVAMLKREYEVIAYTTDADAPGEAVVMGKKKDFPLSTAFGPMLWVERTPKIEWTRPNGQVKTIKDVNDIAQYFMDEKIESPKQDQIIQDVTAKAKPIIVLAAGHVGTLEGTYKETAIRGILRPLVIAMPDQSRLNYSSELAEAIYPSLGKTERMSLFNKWLGKELKAAKGEDEDRTEIIETFGEWIPSAEDPKTGWLLEMIYDPESRKAMLVYRNPQGEIGVARQVDINGKRYVPKIDEFVTKGIVVFPSALGPLKSTSELLFTHELFLRKSFLLDKLSDYKMAGYYSVFTWVYDCFGELPFLRARGGKDTGKSAFMLRLGYLCYRLCKSTGIGSTASLKHAQEKYKGTVFFDEMDIADKFDERIVMLNVRAMKDQAFVWSMKPVTVDGDTIYEPQAHNVYGPALITMYGSFSDDATDSRCITFDLFGKDLAELKKAGIPRRLNAEWHKEAAAIRNMSLHWRMKWWQPNMEIPEGLEDETVSTRANQVTVPIKYIVKDDPEALKDVTNAVREMYADEILERAQSFPARFLEAIISLIELPKYQFLNFVHEGELKDYGHAKYIRYPDLAKTVNYILDEMNTGVEKDIQTLLKSDDEDKETETDGKGKKKKKKKEEEGVSSKTVGNVVRKDLRLPVDRHGAGYVVIVWSQSRPSEVQERIEKLRSKFGLDFIREEAAKSEEERYAEMADAEGEG